MLSIGLQPQLIVGDRQSYNGGGGGYWFKSKDDRERS